MAGSDPTGAFVVEDVRDNLRAAMLMGLPEDPAKRPVFKFKPSTTYAIADKAGRPFNWRSSTTPLTSSQLPDITCGSGAHQVVCALDYDSAAASETSAGDFNPDVVVITMLDVDYVKVQGFQYVQIGDAQYFYTKTRPDVGLFELTVYQITVTARDEA